MQNISDLCSKLTPKDLFGHNLVPASWGASTNQIFPIPRSYQWSTLKSLVEEIGVTKSIIVATPPLWQIEHLAYSVAKSISVPLSSLSPRNLQLIKPACEEVGVDVIIIAKENIGEMTSLLTECVQKPKLLLVVTTEPSEISLSNEHFIVAEEIHLIPGIPLFFQNTQLAKRTGKRLFKKNKIFTWDTDEIGNINITGSADWTVPISNFTVPFTATQSNEENELFHVQKK